MSERQYITLDSTGKSTEIDVNSKDGKLIANIRGEDTVLATATTFEELRVEVRTALEELVDKAGAV